MSGILHVQRGNVTTSYHPGSGDFTAPGPVSCYFREHDPATMGEIPGTPHKDRKAPVPVTCSPGTAAYARSTFWPDVGITAEGS